MATITGSGASETLPGSNGDDTVSALGGNDVVNAGAGNDSVFGGSGNDTLNGGAGADTLDGGSGNDIFDYNSAGETTGDRINDFTRFADRIDLSGIDARSFSLLDPSSVGNNAFAFKGDLTQNALGKGDLGFFVHDGVTEIRGNTDGDAQFEVSLTLNGTHFFTANDFIL